MTISLAPREDLFAETPTGLSAGEIPDRFRIDFSTPLEGALRKISLFCPPLALIFLLAWFEDPGNTVSGWLGGLLFGSGVLAVLLYWSTDNFYIFDRTEQKIFYHFQFLFQRRIEPVAAFSEVLAVTVASERFLREAPPSYWHSIALVISQDQVLPLSDQKRNSLAVMTRDARRLAEAIDVPFIPGLENAGSRIITLPDGQVTVLPEKVQTTFREILLALALAGIMFFMYYHRMTWSLG